MNTTNPRRRFLKQFAATVGAAALLPLAARAAGAEELTETDPTAMALGYKKDTTKVDKTKYPQHTPAQKCSGCALYTGKPGDKQGPCTAFANKIVKADGWCMAYAKKP
ncbi:high-potential iron-sulfur protein [Actomonas aquatica]|uniref:High-potential iron-sulfur protein n=1 Tax=Actomonas aquatica TaxID=2866162 RepID=A0ABZ1C3U3_9BACT|nr:high-potential iron-sulfur protein [Opitutus sp. WL0086]WRQ86339.1 high-potential iron-sulfur protein [Opitutus sp. WL0086]